MSKRLSWHMINVTRLLYIGGELDDTAARLMMDPGCAGGHAVEDLLRIWGYERHRRTVERLTQLG